MNLSSTIKLYRIDADAINQSSEGHSTFPAHGHPETSNGRDKQRKGGADKGGVNADSAGTQTTGAAKNRKYKVVDRMGRVVNSFDTFDEAKKASAGNTYTKVVPSKTSDDDQSVRDRVRNNPSQRRIDKADIVQRRSVKEPDSYTFGKS